MNRFLFVPLLALLAWVAAQSVQAQPSGQAREFRFPLFTQNRQTGLLTGTGARTQPNGTVVLEAARVEHYDPKGNTNGNLLVLATNCTVDLRQSRVSSTNGLHVATADGQLTLEGVGFLWTQDGSDLVVSNQVHTTVRKRLGADATPADTLTIQAGHLRFNHSSNLVVFRAGVQATDPDLEVRCDELTIRRGASGRFDRLLAERDVAILSRRDGSRATSGRAEYRLAETGEVVELTGEPRWTDATREARADRFLLERSTRTGPQTLRALGRAALRLPAGTNSLAGWSLLGPAPRAAAADVAPPPGFLELAADALTLVLPPTNGPVRSLLAETQVVIRDTDGTWRATATRAAFTNDVLELTGDPAWLAGGREVHGDRIRLHTAERGVDVLGHARLRLPLQSFSDRLVGLASTNRPGARSATNFVVLVESEAARFREGRLDFAPPVRARLVDGELAVGELTARDLNVAYRDRLEAIEAAGDVRLQQFARPDRLPLTRTIECERLRLDFAPGGLLARLQADGGVRGEQAEVRRPQTPRVLTTVVADQVEARFQPGTNRLETAAATGHVRVARDERRAEAGAATYSETNGWLVLAGQPVVIMPEGRVSDATSLTWETRSNRARGQGAFRIEWTRIPTNHVTNLLNQPALHQTPPKPVAPR